ncbi:MAG: hypothetical protein NZ870_01885 [bacterium]|nr:hypothetical protein [bacterium]
MIFFTVLFSAPIVINEVAPSELAGADWIEFYVNQDGDYSGYQVFEASDTLVKVFPSPFMLKKGDFVILVFNSSNMDDLQNRILYTTDSGLTATDNVISLKNASNVWIDAVGFSNRDGDISSTAGGYYNNMKHNNMWLDGPESFINDVNDVQVQNALVDWSKGNAGRSISRKADGLDTNSVDDFWFTHQTKGSYNFPQLSTKTLVAPNPFVIGKDRVVRFLISDSEFFNSNIYKLRIFTISGVLVNELTNTQIWDGKDSSGNYVPTGTYIFTLETSSRRFNGKVTVINPYQ